MPAAWARATASAIGIAIRRTSPSLIPWRGMTASSVFPGTYSITMKSFPSADSISWMVTMFGWLRAEAARASWTKRRRRLSSAIRSAGRTLIATSRPRRVSRARYTSPIPPAPTSERTSYDPSFEPGFRAISVLPEVLDHHEVAAPVLPLGVQDRLAVGGDGQAVWGTLLYLPQESVPASRGIEQIE